jgi:6-pyruvoyltetrahydropterin/6-carboxytetrahydropterin synthase
MDYKMTFNRVYRFTSAHRLHSEQLSDAENIDVYEKCNNYNGHGHDYTLEVSVQGIPDETTGMIIPLEEFDHKVQNVINKMDYKHLNYEVDFFKQSLSTGEIIIQYLWDGLNKNFKQQELYHLKLWETNNNYFELGVQYD